MAKCWGNIKRNEKKVSGGKQPDLKGSIRVGGFTGNNCDEKNRECAQFLKQLASDFAESQETWVSVAMWKRVDEDTQEPYFALCLEDNSWKKTSNGTKKSFTPKKAESSGDDAFDW